MYGKLTVNTRYCTVTSGETAGWKPLSGTYTTNFTSNNLYAFGYNGSTATTTHSATTGVPGTNSGDAHYGYFGYTCTNCRVTGDTEG